MAKNLENTTSERELQLGKWCSVEIQASAKLAVELDGGGHGFPDQRARDEKRNQFLAQQGIKVMRFWNHQLRGELETVRLEIWLALLEQTGRTEEIAGYLPKPAPSPQPSPPIGARESEG